MRAAIYFNIFRNIEMIISNWLLSSQDSMQKATESAPNASDIGHEPSTSNAFEKEAGSIQKSSQNTVFPQITSPTSEIDAPKNKPKSSNDESVKLDTETALLSTGDDKSSTSPKKTANVSPMKRINYATVCEPSSSCASSKNVSPVSKSLNTLSQPQTSSSCKTDAPKNQTKASNESTPKLDVETASRLLWSAMGGDAAFGLTTSQTNLVTPVDSPQKGLQPPPQQQVWNENQDKHLDACINLFIKRMLLTVRPVNSRQEWNDVNAAGQIIREERLTSICNALRAIENFDDTDEDMSGDSESLQASLCQSQTPVVSQSVDSEREARILQICEDLCVNRIEAENYLIQQEIFDRSKAASNPNVESNPTNNNVKPPFVELRKLLSDSSSHTKENYNFDRKGTTLPNTCSSKKDSPFANLKKEIMDHKENFVLMGDDDMPMKAVAYGLKVLEARWECFKKAIAVFVGCSKSVEIVKDSSTPNPPELPPGLVGLIGRVLLSRTKKAQQHLFKDHVSRLMVDSIVDSTPKMTAAFKAFLGTAFSEVCCLAKNSTIVAVRMLLSNQYLSVNLFAPSKNESSKDAAQRTTLLPEIERKIIGGILVLVETFWLREMAPLIHFRIAGVGLILMMSSQFYCLLHHFGGRVFMPSNCHQICHFYFKNT